MDIITEFVGWVPFQRPFYRIIFENVASRCGTVDRNSVPFVVDLSQCYRPVCVAHHPQSGTFRHAPFLVVYIGCLRWYSRFGKRKLAFLRGYIYNTYTLADFSEVSVAIPKSYPQKA